MLRRAGGHPPTVHQRRRDGQVHPRQRHAGADRSTTTRRQAHRGDQPTGAGGMHRHHRGQRLGARCVRRGEEARDHIGSARHQRQGALHG